MIETVLYIEAVLLFILILYYSAKVISINRGANEDGKRDIML